jgi:hypothetical protein
MRKVATPSDAINQPAERKRLGLRSPTTSIPRPRSNTPMENELNMPSQASVRKTNPSRSNT